MTKSSWTRSILFQLLIVKSPYFHDLCHLNHLYFNSLHSVFRPNGVLLTCPVLLITYLSRFLHSHHRQSTPVKILYPSPSVLTTSNMGPKAKKLRTDDDTCKGEVFMVELSDILLSQGFDLDYKALANKFKESKQSEYSLRFFFYFKLIAEGLKDEYRMSIHQDHNPFIDVLKDHTETLSLPSMLPKAFELYAELGRHPSKEAAGGVDYPAIYRAFAAYMRGHLPPAFNLPTAAKMLSFIDNLVKKVEEMTASPSWKPQLQVQKPMFRKDPKSNAENNLKLASRRSEEWTADELIAREDALSDDMAKVRLSLGPEIGFNPFGYVFPR